MPDVKLNVKASATGTNQIEGLTSSMIKAQLATQAIIAAAKELVKIGTESVNKFIEQEKAETKLNSALKVTGIYSDATAKQLQQMASDLQDVTEYGDEASLAALGMTQQLADLNENQLKTILPRIQDFAAAMGVDLNTAASLVGKTIGSSTNALSRYGIEIDTSLDKSAKFDQLIGALDAKFGGMAQTIGDTTAGDMAQLNNAIGDLGESFGALIISLGPALDDITEFVKGVTGIVDMLNKVDSTSISTYSGVLERMVADGKDIGEALELIAQMTGKSKEQAEQLYLVNEDLKQVYIDQKNELTAMARLHQAMYGNIIDYLQEQHDAQEEANQSASTWAENYAKAIDDIESKFAEIEETGSFADLLGEDFDIMSEKGKALEEVIGSLIDNGYKIEGDTIQGLLEKYKDIINANKDLSDAMGEVSDSAGQSAGEIKNRMGEAVDSMGKAGAVGEIQKDWKEMFQNIIGFAKEFTDQFGDIVGLIGDIVSQNYQNMIDEVQRSLDAQLDAIDEWALQQMEIYGVAEETRQEQLQREIEELRDAIANETDEKEKQSLEEQLIEKEKELKRQEILDEAEKKKKEAEQKAAMEKWRLEVQEFNAEQKFAKAQAWIDYASGLMGMAARASRMLFGRIAFIAGTTAMLSTKLGLTLSYINKQKPPEAPTFAGGGIVGGNQYQDDRIKAYVNSGEMILNQSQQLAMWNMIKNGGAGGFDGGGVNIYGNINLPNVKNPAQFIRELQRIEAAR